MEANKDQITFFAKTNFRNKEVPFGIKADDRRRHMYVIGKTGMGKTTLLENMAIQDIRNGHGVCFIDPHGDSVVKILNFIPSSRVNDVIYVNPADLEFPVAFNILEAVDTKYKHLVASGLMGVFTKIWANLWSARMEYILNNTILALLDSPGNTMLGITRMYIDKKYRKKIIDNIKDPMVRAFWVDEWANYAEKFRTEAVAPIQNKVGQFLSSAIIRNIVGQPKSTIDLRDIMDNKKILLMDLSKGKVGEDNSALLGAMIITKLQLAALSRVDIPEDRRADFYLYVDEFQNFATESFATILSEARKYHLNLIVGHQYIGQLISDKNNTKLRDAIFGNVGTIVCFRVGAADAEYLETEFAPTYTPNDLVNLPKYNILLRLMINGVASEPFSAVTMPVNPDFYSGNAEKVIKVSRERYANSVAEVEEKISRWMGVEFHEQTAILLGAGSDDSEETIPSSETLEVPAPVMFDSSTTAPEEVARKDYTDAPISEKSSKANVIGPSSQEETSSSSPHEGRLGGVIVQDKDEKSDDHQTKARTSPTPPQEEGREKLPAQPQQQKSQSRQFEKRNQQPRNDRHDPKQFRRRDDAPRQKFKPKKQESKPSNPIWDTVANLEKTKIEKIEKIFDDNSQPHQPVPEARPAPSSVPSTPSGNPSKQVIQPGQSVKFD